MGDAQGGQEQGFLDGGGELGALMRAHDWSSSPIGAPATWPSALRSVVSLMINSRYPMFVAWGPELAFLYNDGYAPIFGAKHPDALGLPFRQVWSEIWQDISPLVERALAGEATFNEDLHLVMHRNGYPEDTWYSFSYSPLRDENGAIAGMFCACTETTQRIKAEDALRRLNDELEKRVAAALAERKAFADVVEGTEAFVQVADREFRWLAINRASADEFERIFGVRPRVGDSMLDALANRPEHREAVRAVWARALAGEAFTETQAFGDPALDRRHYEMRFSPLRDADGSNIGAYQFVYDVTDRMRAQAHLAETEEALRQSRKMELIGQLTGGVAHDFNNLLTPIVGALEMIQRSLPREERLQKLTGGALQAAERARMLIHRLLSFSRRQHLQPRAVDVPKLVEGMADLIARSLGPNTTLVLEMPNELLPGHVDPNQLELALLNLAVNARDAMPNGGTLTISVGMDKRGDRNSGGYIRLAVIDSGIGMDEATLQRAVEPFFTTKEVGRGTGLGLSSVQGMAVQSGGEFELHSRPGLGTTAVLWIPVSADALQEESPAPQISSPDAENARGKPSAAVLLVDDETLVRMATASMLTEAGYEVTEAGSGLEALQIIANGYDCDAVVTDFAMPGMTGVELARDLHKRRPDLPILMITGYSRLSDRETDGLPRLAKPFRQSDLARAVASLLHDSASLARRLARKL